MKKISEAERKELEAIQQRVAGLNTQESLERIAPLKAGITLRRWDLKRNQIHPAHLYRLEMMEAELKLLQEHLSGLAAGREGVFPQASQMQ